MGAKAKRLKAFIDGASRGNPGPAAIGVVLEDDRGRLLKKIGLTIGQTTNNVAETLALIFVLQEAMLLKAGTLEVFTDSELVAKQFSGEYKIKDPSLKVFSLLINHLRPAFQELTVTHVRREQNTLADQAANDALDGHVLF